MPPSSSFASRARARAGNGADHVAASFGLNPRPEETTSVVEEMDLKGQRLISYDNGETNPIKWLYLRNESVYVKS